MPIEEVTSGSSADMARYHELINKADLLYGQGQKVLEVIGKLDALVESMTWQGVRAEKFRKKWNDTYSSLSGWAGSLNQLSETVRDEAKNYLGE